MYTCSCCGGTLSVPMDVCPHCRVLLSGVKCQSCGYLGAKSEFIANHHNCPKCGVRAYWPSGQTAAPALPLHVGLFFRRAAAHLADSLLYLAVFLAGGAVATAVGREAIALPFLLVFVWVYTAGLESSALQATAGKWLLGVKVTSDGGERLTFGRASARLAAKCLSGLTLGVGFLMALFTEKERALHDKMAGTLVVKR